MTGAAARWIGGVCAALVAFVLGFAAQPASAFEFFDGRLQVHGFYEMQTRALVRDFNVSDDVDLAQWYHVLNVEIESDVFPDGLGPFDLVSAFARIEVRYDCVWTRGCGLFSSADTYGNRAKTLPKRLGDGHRGGFTGHIPNFDHRRYIGIPRTLQGIDYKDAGNFSYEASQVWDLPGITAFFGISGADGVLGSPDDPANVAFGELLGEDCLYGIQKRRGPDGGNGTRILPWTPACDVKPLALNAGKPNPFRGATDFFGNVRTDGGDENVVALGPGVVGSTERPFKPAPDLPFTASAGAGTAKGIWYPSNGLQRKLRKGSLDSFDQNFRQAEFEWNRGASQQDEKELKELYVDLEAFDSRLWLRLGKQQIVWGKTELFRTTDQFNPQDLALASLPSLEESRIALWAIRGVWSFYDVGPFEDLRLEVAMNYDQMEPADLGRCGEPFSPLPVCDKTFGLQAHGLTGVALAGEQRPTDPWNGTDGIEVGARVEWRWDRFSFALVDFWGYNDFPHIEQIFRYTRNVDPSTGRPRRTMRTGSCSGDVFLGFTRPDGLAPDPNAPADNGISGKATTTAPESDCLTPANALEQHSINQTLFALVCASSIGFNELDTTACGQSVFQSKNNAATRMPAANPAANPTIASLLANALTNNTRSKIFLDGALTGGALIALDRLVSLNADPCDGMLSDCATMATGVGGIDQPNSFFTGFGPSLNTVLTQQQKALFGCGEFYGSNCEIDGIDLSNSEVSALMQSWIGFEGTGIDGTESGKARIDMGDAFDASIPQPGTVGFSGGPPCTRFVQGTGVVTLPGCRADGSPGHDPSVDGTNTGLFHPDTGQQFASEMAAASFNLMQLVVALSSPSDPLNPTPSEFDVQNVNGGPARTNGCSFRRPILCGSLSAFYSISGVERNTLRAGGNVSYGRRDFIWHGGSEAVLSYEKRNVLGISMDAAEDVTKTNWSFELTWIEGLQFADNNELDGLSESDSYNLTISVDRPTFINFLNANRTFFFNSQIFFQYLDSHGPGFTTNGPWNMLATFTVFTGYFQDRLNPSMTLVWDMRSSSTALLTSFNYRLTESFSATWGVLFFAGHEQAKNAPLTTLGLPADRVGPNAYNSYVENGLSLVRERDEIFLRIKYTF